MASARKREGKNASNQLVGTFASKTIGNQANKKQESVHGRKHVSKEVRKHEKIVTALATTKA